MKALLAVALAVVALGALVGTATANRLSFSSQTFRGAWTSWEFSGGFGTTRCNLTIEGSLHSASIVKTVGALIGYITRASAGTCTSGSPTILSATLPWHIRYESFTGTLPNITSITGTVIGMAFSIRETFGITCLAMSEAAHGIRVIIEIEAGGIVIKITWGGRVPTSCGVEGTLGGASGTPTVAGSTTRITVRLI